MAIGTDAVPVDALRDYFTRGVDRGDFTASEIADRLGWTRRNRWGPGDQRIPDSGRVLRALGLKTYETRGHAYRAEHLRYERAVALCRALGADPIDVDL